MAYQKKQHRLRNDRYVNARGGNSHFLDLYCSRCGQHLALYQKDGLGSLLRMYLDRIFEPQELAALQFKSSNKKDISNFKCSKCGALIGMPMVYDLERRLAFRLLHGSFVKKKSDGIYPPSQQNSSSQNTEKEGSNERNIRQPTIVDMNERTKMSAEEVNGFLDLLKRSMEPFSKRISVIENDITHYYAVERRGLGILKTKHGKFWQYDFTIDDQWKKYSVIVKAELDQNHLIPIFKKTDQLVLRIDSSCETGQVFGDLTCECHEQLHLALKIIEDVGEGIIIHIPRQDGRGMGLTFKLATLWLQDVLGVNTVESAMLLTPGEAIDIRTYSGVICILKFFGIPETCKINLITNNPKKMKVFAENGYTVDYLPIVVEPNKYTEIHLKAKQEYLGHKGLIKKGENVRAIDQILTRMKTHNTLLCCGLDPDLKKMPSEITEKKISKEEKVLDFLRTVVDVTAPHVCAYKVQKAFFDVLPAGHEVLKELINYIHILHKGIPIIVDCKIGDIDNTMAAYIHNLFDVLQADGIVVNPYMGDDVMVPLAEFTDKAIVVLVKTSNPSGSIVQDVMLHNNWPLWRHILDLVVNRWDQGKNMIPVIPSTSELNMSEIRSVIPDKMPILLVGIGAQGGSYVGLHQLLNSEGIGVLVNSSRGILYPKSEKQWRIAIEEAATKLKDTLNKERK